MRAHRPRAYAGWFLTTVALVLSFVTIVAPLVSLSGFLDAPLVAAQAEAAPTVTDAPILPTEIPPTATDIPPTATEIPPTATEIPIPTATEIALPTATEIPPPTATDVPPTATNVPPTATEIPPTATVVPTATSTSTSTPIATPTNTPLQSVACVTQTLLLAPSADAYVYQANPTTASGSSPELRVRQSSTQQYESYLTFNVTGTTGGISKAELTLTTANYAGADTASAPDVRIVTGPWSEGSVTWDTKPAYGAIVAAGGGAWGQASPYTWDVTTAVTANGSVSLALIPNSSDTASANSREQASGGRPVLTITFGCGGSNITPTSAPILTPTLAPTPTPTQAQAPTAPPPTSVSTTVACAPATFSIVANADAMVTELSPTANYGSGLEVRARLLSGNSAETYLSFNVSGLTDTVTNATLRLTTATYAGADTASAPNVAMVTGAWSESGITWATKPSLGGVVATGGGAWGVASPYTWDVTTAVTGNGAVSLALIGTSSDQVSANSREQNAAGSAGKPTLIVTTCGVTAPTPTVAVTPSPTAGPTLAPTVTSTPSPTGPSIPTPTPTVVACTSTTSSFVVSADAFVNQSSPTTNYGAGAELRAKILSSASSETYLSFNVSGLTDTVTNATLRLMTANYAGTDTVSAPDVAMVTGAWSESTITWSTKPSQGALIAQGRTAWATNATYTWDVTSAVTGNGAVSLALIGTTSDQVTANSREQNAAGSAGKPTLIVTTCGGTAPTPTVAVTPIGTVTPTATTTPSPTPTGTVSPGPAAVMVAVGDIACKAGSAPTSTSCQQQATSNVAVQANPDTVLVLGDNQYECGSSADFSGSYGPSWGQLKNVTHPVIGNHEYNWGDGVNPPCAGVPMPSGAQGYWTYFGDAATPLQPGCRENCLGYYSYDVGAWHVVVLNSMLCTGAIGGSNQCYVGSPQQTWLKNDLQGRSNQCVIAAWHHPLFSTGEKAPGTKALWDTLYAGGAEIVLAGHLHRYEQFGPQDGAGNASPYGMREFVVGTGGRNFQKWSGRTAPNLEVVNDSSFGVLRLTLRGNGYDWQFLSAAGGQLSASGSDNCHGAPAATTGSQSLAASSNFVAMQADLTGIQQQRRLVRHALQSSHRNVSRKSGKGDGLHAVRGLSRRPRTHGWMGNQQSRTRRRAFGSSHESP